MTHYFTAWRCGCTLLSEDHQHPPHCPHHAPGMTTWSMTGHAARTERIGTTEAITRPLNPGVTLGLEIAERGPRPHNPRETR